MSRSPKRWHATVLSNGLESAIVDKYADLFAADPILAQAWADHQAAEARIHARMDALADATPPPPDAAQGPMTSAPEGGSTYFFKDKGGMVWKFTWDGSEQEAIELSAGNIFRTEADARAALQAEKGGK